MPPLAPGIGPGRSEIEQALPGMRSGSDPNRRMIKKRGAKVKRQKGEVEVETQVHP